ncbi:L-2-hydroxyglutarate oxidase [Thermodesulfovibrio yellowstonii]|uniref:Aminobutyraldehyde dehydrogenase n=1 Tax=Thermodesulfovibrio yellowstonii TaxID=28262 RepID=A0A9W6GF21_9BACT|nr:L-2-hydroxyglutarate oxidase [Thermodesulfovibrio islandicus]GLI52686.1 aminobutyraldehyde dehydrogenase [Thermodesulfovibrio islandicus]
MIIICGAGITGLSLARELVSQGIRDITIIEKEASLGRHASGRNSGVLHAGIYYTPDSLKARFCLRGNLLMRQYCKDRNLTLIESGKVIVTKRESEIPVLHELYKRAKANGAEVELIDEKTLKEIEPYAKTCKQALYSPLTAVINPKEILESLERELGSLGVRVEKGVVLKGIRESRLFTNKGELAYELFINAAGAHADRIAHLFGLAKQYRIVPFKGLYKKLRKEKSHLVRGNIYPVPDIKNPFLGIHFTKVHDGTVYVGPTATPALGRENYGLLDDLGIETLKILWRDFSLLLGNEKFRNTALTEIKKYRKANFYRDIKDMIEGVETADLLPSKKVGIRPQLIDIERKELVMDFLVIKDTNTLHILNAISPAFTSAFAFAEYVVKDYILGARK